MEEKKQRLTGEIVTVGDLIEQLKENYDREEYILSVYLLTTTGLSGENGVDSIWTAYVGNGTDAIRRRMNGTEERKPDQVITREAVKNALEQRWGKSGSKGYVTRVWNVLQVEDVRIADDLRRLRKTDLLEYRNCGKSTLKGIEEVALFYGIQIV